MWLLLTKSLWLVIPLPTDHKQNRIIPAGAGPQWHPSTYTCPSRNDPWQECERGVKGQDTVAREPSQGQNSNLLVKQRLPYSNTGSIQSGLQKVGNKEEKSKSKGWEAVQFEYNLKNKITQIRMRAIKFTYSNTGPGVRNMLFFIAELQVQWLHTWKSQEKMLSSGTE